MLAIFTNKRMNICILFKIILPISYATSQPSETLYITYTTDYRIHCKKNDVEFLSYEDQTG